MSDVQVIACRLLTPQSRDRVEQKHEVASVTNREAEEEIALPATDSIPDIMPPPQQHE